MSSKEPTPPAPTNVLIVGATAGIAKPVARVLARDAAAAGRDLGLVLAGRDADELERLAADLRVRSGCRVATRRFDAADLDASAALFAGAAAALDGGLHGLVLAHGWLPDPAAAKADPATIRRLVDVNYTSAVLVLEAAAAYFEERKAEFVCGISSVAGDRGRQSNYPYGATKAALTTYLQGLRNRLHPAGVPVLTVKPGFVDTSMTWGLIRPGSPLNARPERVARDVVRAIRRRRNVVYTPWFWRGILGVLKAIPEPVFKRMRT
ncbi:MAG TPA: SDR family NAD(P)-dependent oxidoreductase [Humisphaera sp.]